MEKKDNIYEVYINQDPVMNFITNKLNIETIYLAFFLHLIILIYVWINGNLFKLNIPNQIIQAIDSSKLQEITPINDPIFITGLLFITVIGYVWFRLSTDLPKALINLRKNGIVKEEKFTRKTERGDVLLFRKPFRLLNEFYTERISPNNIKKEKKDIDHYEIFLIRFEKALNSKVSYLVGIGATLLFLYIINQYALNTPIDKSFILTWVDYRIFPVNAFLYELLWAICYFIIAIMVWKLIQTAIYIKGIFKEFNTEIKPFHPDKCGGLKPITSIVMNINMFVFAAGIALVIIYYSYFRVYISNIWFFLFGYVIVSIFLFFWPLLGARESMKNSKEKFIELFSMSLNQEYELIFQEFKDGIDKFDEHLDERHLKKILTLRDIYERASLMPVWPYDRDSILQFASRVLLPILLIVISIFLEKYI